jgi:hypothetical protein
MTVTASLTGSPSTRNDTATAEESSSKARRSNSSLAPSSGGGSDSRICSGKTVFLQELFTHTGRLATIAIWSISAIGDWTTRRRDVGRRCLRVASTAMKIFYKPFGLIAGMIGARAGRGAFEALWSRIDLGDPPAPTTEDASLTKVVLAATLEAATMAGIAAAVDRGSARAFHYLTGIWPGKHR